MNRAPTRRDFIAGLIASLALCFTPYERFAKYLEAMLRRVYAAPMVNGKLYNWKQVEIWIAGKRFIGTDEIVWRLE